MNVGANGSNQQTMLISVFKLPNYAYQNMSQTKKSACTNLQPTCTALYRTLLGNILLLNLLLQTNVGANGSNQQTMLISVFKLPNHACQNMSQTKKNTCTNLQPTCTALYRTLLSNILLLNLLLQMNIGANGHNQQTGPITVFIWPNYACQNVLQIKKSICANLQPFCTALNMTLLSNILLLNPMLQMNVDTNEDSEQ